MINRIYKIPFLFFLTQLCLFFCFISCESSTENGGSVKSRVQSDDMKVMHTRVIWTNEPSNHAIISWTSSDQGGRHLVKYVQSDQKPSESALRESVQSMRDGKISIDESKNQLNSEQGYFHHAEMVNLDPDSKYYFRVCSDDACSDIYWFRTAPLSGTDFSLLFGGDSRIGGNEVEYGHKSRHTERQIMNKNIATLVEKDPSILAFVHGADFCSNAEWRYLYWWFEDYEYTITSDNRILPLIISRGNHDMEIGFVENFWLGDISYKNSDGYYFNTEFGSDVNLITLNTETSLTGDQRKWLENELKRSRPQYKWLFVQYHKPAWPATKPFEREDFARIRKHWIPLLEEYDVDLVVESDGHTLKRTVPILNNKKDDKGIIYIGEGGLGVPQRKADPARWYFKDVGLATSAHHVWKMTFKNNYAQVSAIGIDRNILDQFTIRSKQ